MSIDTAGSFFQTLQKSRLFNEAQLQHLAGMQHLDVPAQLLQLTQAGWLTNWQAERLRAGQAAFYLGRYRLLSEAGRGNTGVVFQAFDDRSQRVVALKLYHAHLCATPDDVQRLLWHVKQASQLDHPHLVCPRDADAAGNKYFVVFDYFEGKNFAASLKAYGKPSLEWSCEAARQAATGLHVLHERGVVHGDLHPTHLFDAAPPGETRPFVKVLGGGMTWYDPLRLPQTETPPAGAAFVSSDFLPPERLVGAPLDARSDLYSLGCVLFTLLTGEAPFAGADPLERLKARTAGAPPPLRTKREEASPELEAVVARLTAYDPRMRYQSAAEAASALAICMSLPSFHTQKVETYKLAEPQSYGASQTISESSSSSGEASGGPKPLVYYPVPTKEELARQDREKARSYGGGGFSLGGGTIGGVLTGIGMVVAFVTSFINGMADHGGTGVSPPIGGNGGVRSAPFDPRTVEGPSGGQPAPPSFQPPVQQQQARLTVHIAGASIQSFEVFVDGASVGGGSAMAGQRDVTVNVTPGPHSVRIQGKSVFGKEVSASEQVNLREREHLTMRFF